MKKLIFITMIFTLAYLATAQESSRPHGRPQRERRSPPPEVLEARSFELFGIRTNITESGMLLVDFKFSKPFDPNSIDAKNILINDKPVSIDHPGFSKDGRNFRILVKNPGDKFSLKISGVKSLTNEDMKPFSADEIITGSIFHIRRKE